MCGLKSNLKRVPAVRRRADGCGFTGSHVPCVRDGKLSVYYADGDITGLQVGPSGRGLRHRSRSFGR